MMIENACSVHTNYASFFTLNALPDGAEMSGNEFLWDFSVQDPELGKTIHITVSAMVSGQNVNWNAVASANFEDGGFEEQQVIEGTSSLDGSTGDWSVTFDVPEEGFTFESNVLWERDGENVEKLDISTSLTEDETEFSQNVQGVYTLEGTSAAISNARILSSELEGENPFGDIDVTQPFSVSWDTGTETGMISIDDRTLCWDESKRDIDC